MQYSCSFDVYYKAINVLPLPVCIRAHLLDLGSGIVINNVIWIQNIKDPELSVHGHRRTLPVLEGIRAFLQHDTLEQVTEKHEITFITDVVSDLDQHMWMWLFTNFLSAITVVLIRGCIIPVQHKLYLEIKN